MNINFDSMGQMGGFPENYRDPSYDRIMNRFFGLSDRYRFKYSIYVIGRDLQDPERAARVREWAAAGHEIGNHTWSHPLNLGALKSQEIRDEIERAHEIISKTIGHEPKGFIAPAWCTSSEVLKTLKSLRYVYDTSGFPSWFMLPFVAKLMMHHLGGADFFKVFRRKDVSDAFFAPRHPYLRDGLVMMPLPTDRFRVACWHTMAFILGERWHRSILNSCLAEEAPFYYLMHPGDLLDQNDLETGLKLRMERIKPNLEIKMKLLERCLDAVIKSGRAVVTMREIADQVKRCS